ncbi:36115_t:CDS:1, partial [Gigaspora margarita]
ENDHIIVCEESLDEEGDIIEKFVESNIEGTASKNILRYNYCNENWVIFYIVKYFSYQYAISKNMDINETESFANYMMKLVNKFSNFDKYRKDYKNDL